MDWDDEEGFPGDADPSAELRARVFDLVKGQDDGNRKSIFEIAQELQSNPKAVLAAVEGSRKMSLDGDEDDPMNCWIYVESGGAIFTASSPTPRTRPK